MEELAENAEISAENAVLIPIIPAVKSIMAYVEAVAVVIGSCHIHSVYEDREYVKVYLKHKRFVDILVNNGITILGRQTNVDFYFPRADKVVLSNVDPIVPDAIVMKLLCYYGTPVTSIIHEKIATNSEYSHILCGRRKVYMNILPDKKIPTTISFNYLDVFYKIHILVEEYDRSSVPETYQETDERSDDENMDDVQEIPAEVINVKPNIAELNQEKELSPKQVVKKAKNRAASHPTVRKITRRVRGGGWYKNKVRKVKRITQTGVANDVGKRTRRLVVQQQLDKPFPSKRKRIFKTKSSLKSPVATEAPSVEETNDTAMDGLDESIHFSENDFDSLSDPLSAKDMEKFLFKTKFHRDPVIVAWEFLPEKTPEALDSLKTQLGQLMYKPSHSSQNVKHRIKRLIAALKFPETPEPIQ